MHPFGVLSDGTQIESVTLGSSEGLQAHILTYGGILRRLTLPTNEGRRDLVLGLPDLEAYVRDRVFIGPIIGRVANRIGGASFELDGRRFDLAANDGPNHLHGGRLGFGKRVWKVLEFSSDRSARLRLGLHSPAGEEGYPGNVDVSADFTVEGDNLHLRLEAISDAPTPINLTYHPYFNLGAHARAFSGDHFLRISAGRFLPVADSDLIPKGELCPVEGTPFDFRRSRPLRLPLADPHPQVALAGGYDHCFVLERTSREVAELRSERSGITLRIHSDEPGLQLYGGQALSREHPGLAPGIALEPQAFPNSPNLPTFPSTILRPDELYSNTIVYRFSREPQNAPESRASYLQVRTGRGSAG